MRFKSILLLPLEIPENSIYSSRGRWYPCHNLRSFAVPSTGAVCTRRFQGQPWARRCRYVRCHPCRSETKKKNLWTTDSAPQNKIFQKFWLHRRERIGSEVMPWNASRPLRKEQRTPKTQFSDWVLNKTFLPSII